MKISMSWEIQKEKGYLRPDTDILFQASQTSKYAYMHIYIYNIWQEGNAATFSVECFFVTFNNIRLWFHTGILTQILEWEICPHWWYDCLNTKTSSHYSKPWNYIHISYFLCFPNSSTQSSWAYSSQYVSIASFHLCL